MFRTVVAFQSNPAPQYIAVRNLTFPGVNITPGMNPVVQQPQTFPNRMFNKAADIPGMSVQTVYNYERSGKSQF